MPTDAAMEDITKELDTEFADAFVTWGREDGSPHVFVYTTSGLDADAIKTRVSEMRFPRCALSYADGKSEPSSYIAFEVTGA